jgi:RNA polymerase sigma-70 factor (ECF subfamily)
MAGTLVAADRSVTDEDLARQTRAGSLAAFEELVARYETRVYRFLLSNTRNQADAADLTQTTFVTAFQRIHRFDPRRRFGTWLFTIGRRAMIDHFRRRKPVEPVSADTPSDDRDPAGLLADAEDGVMLWGRVRAALTADQFQATWLRYQEDLSVGDIARVMKKTTINVKVLLYRARQTLRPLFTMSEETDHDSIQLGNTIARPGR